MRIRDDYLLEIARSLTHELPGWKIIIPAMIDNCESLQSLFHNTSNITVLDPSQTVRPLLPLIQYANLVITPDTALVHIACAYDIPLVAIYTSEQALFDQWRPLHNESARVVRSRSKNSIYGFSITELLLAVSELINYRA